MLKNLFEETLYDAWCQQFRVDEVLFEFKTEHQHLVIFQNQKFGRVMALDGVVQTTQADEFVYHEMLTHVPIFAHGNVKRVLIIGGGDGGILREVAKHKSIEHITMVEIDKAVVDMAKKYLPGHSDGAFDDKRLNLVIDDGAAFVVNTKDKFDVIISDSTDPMGPGEVLFTKNFYEACHACMNPGGVLVTQNGVAFMQLDEVKTTARRLAPTFKDCHFYAAAVPTYVGGVMTLSWATDNADLRKQPIDVIEKRFDAANIKTRYYTPGIHTGAFHLPRYVLDAMKDEAIEK